MLLIYLLLIKQMNQRQILRKLLKGDLITEPLYISQSKQSKYSAVAVILRYKQANFEKRKPLQEIQQMLDTQILLLQRVSNNKQYSGQICFPGGKIEEGQSVVQTAIRQTQEETNLKLTSYELLGVLSERFVAQRHIKQTLYTYAVLFYQTQYQQIADYRWIPLKHFMNEEVYRPIYIPYKLFTYLISQFDIYTDIHHFQWPAVHVTMSKNLYGLSLYIIGVFIVKLNYKLEASLAKLMNLLENQDRDLSKSYLQQLVIKLKLIQQYGIKIRDLYFKELRIVWKKESKLTIKQKQQMHKTFLNKMQAIFPHRYHHL